MAKSLAYRLTYRFQGYEAHRRVEIPFEPTEALIERRLREAASHAETMLRSRWNEIELVSWEAM
jgi:hypothetical protein